MEWQILEHRPDPAQLRSYFCRSPHAATSDAYLDLCAEFRKALAEIRDPQYAHALTVLDRKVDLLADALMPDRLPQVRELVLSHDGIATVAGHAEVSGGSAGWAAVHVVLPDGFHAFISARVSQSHGSDCYLFQFENLNAETEKRINRFILRASGRVAHLAQRRGVEA